MGLLPASVTGVLLLLALSACLCGHEIRLIRSVHAKSNESGDRNVSHSVKPKNNSYKRWRIHLEKSPSDAPRDDECTMALESRFDCARDRVLGQRECEERGCCYSPLPNSGGPPWCFYPPSYHGYAMGPLTPTPQGQAATLTRARPSYLPKDISTLRLDIMEETAGRLHLTVSTQYSAIPLHYSAGIHE